MLAYGYGTAPSGTDLMLNFAEVLSLIFIVASFLILAYLALKVRSRRSFQFEMFLFALILGSAEVPAVLYQMSGLDLGVLVTYGLEVHSVSMVFLAAFVAYRIYGFFRGNAVARK